MPSSSTGTGDRAQPVDLKDLQRTGIGRRFDDDLVAGFGQALRDDRDALRRSGQHDDARRARSRGAARVHARRNRRAQRLVAFANRRTRGRSADRARRARTIWQVRRSGDGSSGATPCTNEIRPPSRGLAASSPSTLGNSPTRQGGSVTHHGTPAARSGCPPRSCGTTREPEPTRCSINPSATSSR